MSRGQNTIKRSEVSTTPITLKYSSSFASSSFSQYGITVNRGINSSYQSSGSIFLNYALIKQLYYQEYLTGSVIGSSSFWNSDLQSTAANGTFDDDYRYFPTFTEANISVIAIPRTVFGEQISRKSLRINGTDYDLVDDGNGNVIDSKNGNTRVGNVLYSQGVIVITNPYYQNAIIDVYTPPPVVPTTTTTTTTTSTTTSTTTATPTTTTSTTTSTTTAAPTTTTSTTTSTTTAAPTTTTSTTTSTTTAAPTTTTSTTTSTTTAAPTTTTSTTTSTTTATLVPVTISMCGDITPSGGGNVVNLFAYSTHPVATSVSVGYTWTSPDNALSGTITIATGDQCGTVAINSAGTAAASSLNITSVTPSSFNNGVSNQSYTAGAANVQTTGTCTTCGV